MKVEEHHFIYPPLIYSKYGFVTYVAGEGHKEISDFVNLEYDSIRKRFSQYGLVFHCLSKEILDRYQEYLDPEIIIYPCYKQSEEEKYLIANLKDIASKADSELILYQEDNTRSESIPPCLVFSDREWHGKNSKEVTLKVLPFGDDVNNLDDFNERIQDMIKIISTFFPKDLLEKRPALYLDVWCFNMDTKEADKWERLYQETRKEGYSDDQILNIIKRIIRRNSKGGHIAITKDYRIILEEFDSKEVALSDLPKALYLFYLKREEGLNINDLQFYMPELAYIYLTIRKSKRAHPLKIIQNLIVNQYYNNFKAIRNAFQKAYDIERNNRYTIERDEKHQQLLAINIPESLRVWHCPDILNKKIPTLPANTKDSIKETWKILHELHDSKIDAAIGNEPPTR